MAALRTWSLVPKAEDLEPLLHAISNCRAETRKGSPRVHEGRLATLHRPHRRRVPKGSCPNYAVDARALSADKTRRADQWHRAQHCFVDGEAARRTQTQHVPLPVRCGSDAPLHKFRVQAAPAAGQAGAEAALRAGGADGRGWTRYLERAIPPHRRDVQDSRSRTASRDQNSPVNERKAR